jgi:hypothetical protein
MRYIEAIMVPGVELVNLEESRRVGERLKQ